MMFGEFTTSISKIRSIVILSVVPKGQLELAAEKFSAVYDLR